VVPEYADYLEILKRRAAAKQQDVRHIFEQRMPQLAEVAFKAQTVYDHPGWQLFADKLESRIAEIQTQRDATAERMIKGSELGQALELLKINLNTMDAEIAALRYAASLIPEAIAHGRLIAGSPPAVPTA
jgi:hypothetical protein